MIRVPIPADLMTKGILARMARRTGNGSIMPTWLEFEAWCAANLTPGWKLHSDCIECEVTDGVHYALRWL